MSLSESQIHVAIVDYLNAVLPAKDGWFVQHTPNKPRSAIQGAKEKRMGAQKGWPDLMIVGPRKDPEPQGWFMEVKKPGGRLSPEQKAMHARLIKVGFGVGTVKSVEEARRLAIAFGLPIRDVSGAVLHDLRRVA
jgi:hypothetical protein